MMKLTILKVEDPSCLWCRVMGAPGGDVPTAEQYNRLLAQMNLFYNDVTQDLRKMKPTALEKGQVCVVYWSFVKSWCRAVVESVIMDSVSCKARCHLVDHGERLIITLDKIRVAMQDFLQLPFWVKRFQLAGIKPITLRVSVVEKAQLIPSTRWDSSATLYLHNLLQASTWTEAVLLESESDSASIQLYLTLGNIKICVNDELVAKKFAYYKSRDSAEISTLDEMDRLPVMLSSTILAQSVSLSSNKATAQTQAAQVMSQGQVEGSAAGWLMVSSPLQNQLKTLEADNRSEVTEKPASPSSISESAAAESHLSDNTDSSLAAALTKKLSLFKSLKLMNPDSSDQRVAHAVSQHEELSNHRPEESNTAGSPCARQEVSTFLLNGESAAPVEDELHASNGRNGAEGLNISQVECQMCEDKSSDTSVESGPAEAAKARRTEGDWACLRLLEWLNPKALNPDPDAADVRVVPFDDARRREVLVHSAFPVEPCSSLDDAPITDALRSVLQRRQYGALSAADRYSWPAVARGCNTVIISSGGKQPFSYVFPLLTHILLNSISCCPASSKGPIAVLLCPGWEKVQVLYETLDKSRIAQTLHPLSVLPGAGKDNSKSFRIPQNCLLMLTTPFSLVRLLSTQCFMFLRLCHLVLHEADQLLTHAPDQMAIILQHFQKVTSSEENANSPQQLVVMAERWTSDMEDLVTGHMPCPCIILTVPVEAALYGNVQQVVLTTPESSKISELLGTLDLNPNVGQKTLIVANCAQEVEDVFKAVSNTSAFCLKIHEGLTEQLDLVVKQWRRDIGHGTHVILVTTTECLQCFGITDATCVVHYSFPASPKDFGKRLFCLSDNFRNLSERVSSPDQTENHPHVARSVLLISEKNVRHAVGVLRYLERTDARTPPELLSFAQGIREAWETQKTSRPLCRLLKSFGVCRRSGLCPDRHKFISCLDQSELPDSGVIEVVPLHVKTASVFYGRIVRKEDGRFDDLASEMASYYADKRPGATEMLERGLYAVEEDDVFHRVRIISILDRGSQLFFRLLVHFIDVGKEEEVKSQQILHLPERFHSLPGQAVELIVCRVKPADAEVDWHPKVTRTISQKIRGLQHRARVVLSLGNTVFVDPMVRVTQMPSLKTVINEYNVQSEILNSGMGVKNLEHVDLLRELCREGRASSSTEAGFSPGSDGVLEEDVLSEVFRAAQVKKLTDLPQLEAIPSLSPSTEPGPGSAHGLLLVPACDQESMSAIQTETEQRNTSDMKSAVTKSGCSGEETAVNNSAPGDNQSSRQQNLATDDSVKSLHPQLRWYQTSGSVIITVKLLCPESQSCDFYCDRVVYSGRVSGQSYRAELELQGAVDADSCFWKMKSNQPVLTLVKQQQGFWEKLLRNKNHFVRYDMEHLDEDEDSAPRGVWFVESTGEEIYYMSSESDSD